MRNLDVFSPEGHRRRQERSELMSQTHGAARALLGPVREEALEIRAAHAEHDVLFEEVGIGPTDEVPAQLGAWIGFESKLLPSPAPCRAVNDVLHARRR